MLRKKMLKSSFLVMLHHNLLDSLADFLIRMAHERDQEFHVHVRFDAMQPEDELRGRGQALHWRWFIVLDPHPNCIRRFIQYIYIFLLLHTAQAWSTRSLPCHRLSAS